MFTMEYEIIDFCKDNGISNYTILDDLSIDVIGSVFLSGIEWDKLPLKFNKVTGGFYCYNSSLLTLEGCPEIVTDKFDCSGMGITSLKGGPNYVGSSYNASNCELTTLEGSPEHVGKDFDCTDNNLNTLKGSPEYIGRHFICSWNKLTSLKGGPKIIKASYYCDNNKIYNLDGFETELDGYLIVNNNPISCIFDIAKSDFIEAFKVFRVVKGNELNMNRLMYLLNIFDTHINQKNMLKDFYKIVGKKK